MARLPSDSDLGQMPGAGYQRPIAVVDNTPITKGIQDVGKGVSDLAGGINVAVKEVKRVGDATDEARATSNYLSGRVKRDAELADLTDEDAIEGHKKTYTDNLDVSAAMIRDPAKRELFRLRYQPNVEQANVAVDKHWEKIDTDRTLASTNESLDNIVKTAPKVSEELRSAALKTINTTIDGLVEAQKITAVQGQKLKKDWAEKYGEAAVGSLPPSQRIAALAMPGNLSGSETDRTMQILRAREGFRSTTYWDVNHHRVGYGSDTITMPDGSVRTVQQGDSVTQADAERDLARRSNDSLAQVRAAIGDEAYGKLSANARAALGSVTYNYGSVPGRVIEAAKSGDGAQLADAIERLQGDNNGVNRQRRLVEAAIARGGNVPGSSVAAIIPEDRRKDIINGANREMNLQSQQEQLAVANERATVKSMMEDDQKSLITDGKPLAELTPERVGKALGPVAQEQFLRTRQNSQDYYDVTREAHTVPSSELLNRVETMKPVPGTAGYADRLSYYETAKKYAAQIIKQRESDPAAAVDKFPDVTAARSGIDLNNPETVATLAKARMRAQEVIGIPESARMPVTKQEAVAIGKPILNAPEGSETLAAIRQVLPFLDKAYGKDADKVLEFALTESNLDNKVAKQAHNMMRKLQRGEPLTPSDAQALQTEQTNAAQKQAAGPMQRSGVDYDPNTGEAYQPEGPKQTRTIPAAAIAELRRNPQAIDAFIQKYGTDDYGRDAAKKAAEALGIRVQQKQAQ